MSKRNQDDVSYEVITQEDPDTGDLLVPLPQELLDKMGWREGDQIEWKIDTQGRWVLSKKS
jgi:hypothetical protein